MSNVNKDWSVKISLRSNTPVVGVEIDPFVQVNYKNSCINLPPYGLSFTWYREKYKCTVHSSKLATVQCMTCVRLKLPVEESFYCSPDCFEKAWKDHLEFHRSASEDSIKGSNIDSQGEKTPRTCGSWSSLADDLLENDNALASELEKKKWVKVGCTRRYAPSMGDFRFHLRLECVAIDSSTGRSLCQPDFLVTDPVIITPPPQPRQMIQLQKINVEDTYDDTTFTVLTYNILADLYTWGSFNYCPSWALMWDYRRENLLNEIVRYGTDIICLQEVQSDHFRNFLEPQLKKYGYSASYKRKNKEYTASVVQKPLECNFLLELDALTMYTNNQFVSDGCAIFYRKDIVRVITTHELEFDKEASSLIKKFNIGQTDSQRNSAVRLMKGNVALILVMEIVNKGKFQDAFQHKICVANTHIFADENFPDVKLFQVSTLVNALEKIAPSSMPLLVCADMNSLPGSAAHHLMTRGKVEDYLVQKSSNPLNIVKHLKLDHSLKLASAYASFFHTVGVEEQLKKMDRETSEPLFTNFTPTFSGTLDYIFFTEDRLQVIALLELLDRESFGDGLPTTIWSSDHIALMAKFKLLTPPSLKSKTPLPLNPYSNKELGIKF